jgi:hypothetical protein
MPKEPKRKAQFKDKVEKDSGLQWRVNTPGLLKEIAQYSKEGFALRIPLQIFGDILFEVGQRAAELNDDQLNALMCRLAIYEISDPYNPNQDKELTAKIIEKGRRKS